MFFVNRPDFKRLFVKKRQKLTILPLLVFVLLYYGFTVKTFG